MALFGPRAMSAIRSLTGVDRTWHGLPISVAIDPKRTYSVSFIPNVVSDKFLICDKHTGNGSSAMAEPMKRTILERFDVELERRKFVSITLNKKRTALAVTIERRKQRKQFCAFSARARLHTAWRPKADINPTGCAIS